MNKVAIEVKKEVKVDNRTNNKHVWLNKRSITM